MRGHFDTAFPWILSVVEETSCRLLMLMMMMMTTKTTRKTTRYCFFVCFGATICTLEEVEWYSLGRIFKALALWAAAFYKSNGPCVCLFVRVFTFEVPFKHIFAPTSQRRMSKILRQTILREN